MFPSLGAIGSGGMSSVGNALAGILAGTNLNVSGPGFNVGVGQKDPLDDMMPELLRMLSARMGGSGMASSTKPPDVLEIGGSTTPNRVTMVTPKRVGSGFGPSGMGMLSMR